MFRGLVTGQYCNKSTRCSRSRPHCDGFLATVAFMACGLVASPLISENSVIFPHRETIFKCFFPRHYVSVPGPSLVFSWQREAPRGWKNTASTSCPLPPWRYKTLSRQACHTDTAQHSTMTRHKRCSISSSPLPVIWPTCPSTP